MSKVLILTEKPSVAKDFASALGASYKKNYYESSEYLITWAYGHLVEIDDAIAPLKWEMESLPIFPQRFSYKPVDSLARKQLQVIRSFLSKVRSVIISTDAGREGELIARLILNYLGWKGWNNTFRFWTSEALTPEVIKKVLKQLKPASQFESLYYSALARQHSDWIVGINLTRLVTLKTGNRSVWSVGRVQTPTLALVVKREEEIENFKPEPYWIIKAVFKTGKGEVYEGILWLNKGEKRDEKRDEEDRERESDIEEGKVEEDTQKEKSKYGVTDEEEARKIVSELSKEKVAVIEKVERKRRVQSPPLLHSLTSLQREANALYGFSASRTLEIVQKLYEEYKCVSYPRTDARYLATSSYPLVVDVLRKLGRRDLISRVNKDDKRVFDDSKLTDHHALIPLAPLPEKASLDEKKVYDLILRKFLGVFMPDYVYEQTKVYTRVGRYLFVSVGRRDVVLGWKELYRESDELKELRLPLVKDGERVFLNRIWSEKKFTQPPPRYTEATLLKEMERLNLGTPATRASIIDNLKNKHYVVVTGQKSLQPTEKGKELINRLRGSLITSPEMTSHWEMRLEEIYKSGEGYRGYLKFIESIKEFVIKEMEKIKRVKFSEVFEETGNWNKHRFKKGKERFEKRRREIKSRINSKMEINADRKKER